MSNFIQRYALYILLAILVFSFATRIIRITVPTRYVFDEVYHALTSKLISRNDPRAYEWWNEPVEKDTAVDWLHPPIAKYTQALGMLAFGENALGWRISSVIFGTLVILVTYQLSQRLFNNQLISLLAAFLASMDGLLLTQSRIAMNDIHVTFFILLAMLVYVKYRQHQPQWSWHWLALSGMTAGLAMGTKWSGLFVLVLLCLFESGFILYRAYLLWTLQDPSTPPIKKSKHGLELALAAARRAALIFLGQRLIISLICLFIVPFAMYVAAYTHMFMQGKSLFCWEQKQIQGVCFFERLKTNSGEVFFEGYVSHFAELHRQIWWYQTNLKATHQFQSRPWQWFLDLRPVWIHVDYATTGMSSNIYAFGNPALFWWGAGTALFTVTLIVLQLGAHVLYKRFHNDQEELLSWQFLFLIVGYWIVWLPWQLSPRIMFFYHYAPAVPLLCILLAYWLIKLGNYQKWLATFVVATLWGCYFMMFMMSNNVLNNTLLPTLLAIVTLFLIIKVPQKWVAGFIVTTIVACFIVWFPHWTAIPVPKEFADKVYFSIKSWK